VEAAASRRLRDRFRTRPPASQRAQGSLRPSFGRSVAQISACVATTSPPRSRNRRLGEGIEKATKKNPLPMEAKPEEPDANMTESERIEWLRARGVQVGSDVRLSSVSQAVVLADSAAGRGEEEASTDSHDVGDFVHVRDAPGRGILTLRTIRVTCRYIRIPADADAPMEELSASQGKSDVLPVRSPRVVHAVLLQFGGHSWLHGMLMLLSLGRNCCGRAGRTPPCRWTPTPSGAKRQARRHVPMARARSPLLACRLPNRFDGRAACAHRRSVWRH
jgi:hypothetical protein